MQSLIPGSSILSGARQNDTLVSGPIRSQPQIGNPSTSSKEHVCKVSSQSNTPIDHHDQLRSSKVHQLAGQGVSVNQLSQNQFQTTSAAQKIASHPSNSILIEPISTNIQNGDSTVLSSLGVRQTAKSTPGAQLGDQADVQAPHELQEVSRQKTLQGSVQKIMVNLFPLHLCSCLCIPLFLNFLGNHLNLNWTIWRNKSNHR